MRCAQCAADLQAGWAVCPFCGTSTTQECSACGQTLQPAWKLCPYCGTAAGVACAPQPTSQTPDDVGPMSTAATFSAREFFTELYGIELVAIFQHLMEGPDESEGVDGWLNLVSPAQIEAAASGGLTRLIGLAGDSNPFPQTDPGLAELERRRGTLLEPLRLSLGELRATTEEVRKLDLPNGFFAEFFHGAGQAANPLSRAGMGAAGGAAIGSLFAPGVGTAIGAAIGAMVGGSSESKRVQGVLERWDGCLDATRDAAIQVCDNAWDVVARSTDLPYSAHFDELDRQWATLEEAFDDMQPGQIRESAEAFLEAHGPLGTALTNLTRFLGLIEPASALPFGALLVEQLSWRPGAWELAADAALAAGDLETCLSWADEGLELDASHEGLTLTKIQALAASGHGTEAMKLAGPLSDVVDSWVPQVYAARGFVSAGQPQDAGQALRGWAEQAGEEVVAATIATDPLLGPALEAGSLGFAVDKEGRMRGLVQTSLFVNDENIWWDMPGGDRGRNIKSWAGKNRKNKPLWVYDWSIWANGKGGLVITTRSVIWKCAFSEPVRFQLAKLDPDAVYGDDQDLVIEGEAVDTEIEGLGEALAALIQQLATVAKG